MNVNRLSEDETKPIRRPKLRPDASVTIYMDGLIILFHDDELTQAAIHAAAHGHSLKIVLLDDDGNVKWPPTISELQQLQALVRRPTEGIFWLFISPTAHPTEPPPPDTFSADLFTEGERSFNRVLDFESHLYDHALERFHRERVVLLNMPQGDFYSASNAETEVCSLEDGQQPRHAKFERTFTSSSLPAADISRSVASPTKHIVLLWRNNATRQVVELFSFPLDTGTPFEVHLFNTPDGEFRHGSQEDHFLMYYRLFEKRAGEKRFFPTLKPGQVRAKRSREVFRGPDSPPCDNTRGSLTEPFMS